MLTVQNNIVKNNIVLYTSENKEISVEVLFKEDTIWLTQKKIADLFDVDRTVVTKHLKNIFEEQELDKNSVSAKFAHTASDGKNYQTS